LALLFTVASISGALHRQAFGQPAGESKSLKTFAHLVLLISIVSIIWGIVYVAGSKFIPILQDFCRESPVCDGVDFETLVDTLRWTLIAMLVFCSFLTWFFIREAVYLGNINSLKKFIPKFAACRTRHPNAPSLHVDGEIVKLFAIYLFCGAFVFGLCFPVAPPASCMAFSHIQHTFVFCDSRLGLPLLQAPSSWALLQVWANFPGSIWMRGKL
jgi:hypothetical protein